MPLKSKLCTQAHWLFTLLIAHSHRAGSQGQLAHLWSTNERAAHRPSLLLWRIFNRKLISSPNLNTSRPLMKLSNHGIFFSAQIPQFPPSFSASPAGVSASPLSLCICSPKWKPPHYALPCRKAEGRIRQVLLKHVIFFKLWATKTGWEEVITWKLTTRVWPSVAVGGKVT